MSQWNNSRNNHNNSYRPRNKPPVQTNNGKKVNTPVKSVQNNVAKKEPETFPVVVMHSDYPSELLTLEQMKLIEKAIMQKIIDEEPQEGETLPTISFYGATHKTGWFVLSCASQASHDWIIKSVPEMQPWSDADLNAVTEKDMPVFHIFIAEITDTADDTLVLKTLKKMNVGLKTDEWKILKREEKILTFMINDESAKVLEQNNFKAFYGFGQITFKKSTTPVTVTPAVAVTVTEETK